MLRCTRYSNRKSCKSVVSFSLNCFACMCEVLEWENGDVLIEKKIEGDYRGNKVFIKRPLGL